MIMKTSMKLAGALMLIASIFGGLSACGGGGGGSGSPVVVNPDPSGSNQVTALIKTDTVVGTGTEATNNKRITVHYTGYLYNATSGGFKGTQFETSVGKTPFTFTLGIAQVIPGWDQGVLGMKVGGKRTLIIPATLAYGSRGTTGIPPNAALVFDVEVLAVQ